MNKGARHIGDSWFQRHGDLKTCLAHIHELKHRESGSISNTVVDEVVRSKLDSDKSVANLFRLFDKIADTMIETNPQGSFSKQAIQSYFCSEIASASPKITLA